MHSLCPFSDEPTSKSTECGSPNTNCETVRFKTDLPCSYLNLNCVTSTSKLKFPRINRDFSQLYRIGLSSSRIGDFAGRFTLLICSSSLLFSVCSGVCPSN